MQKVVFPAFSGENYQPYEIRQLVSALELRFQSLESAGESLFDTTTNDFDDRYSLIGHTHSESEITDLQAYLTDITGESIFDLSDVSGTPANDDILQWNSVSGSFEVVPASAASVALNDLTDVSIPSPLDNEVLTFDAGSGVWVAASSAGLTSFFDLSDTDLTGQTQYDLVYNADGSEWQNTDGALIWNPAFDYLQLANAHSINWLDIGFATTELLVFEEATGASSDPNGAEVVLLLSSQGRSDGETALIDRSSYAHAVSFGAAGDHSTDQTKFNATSLDVRSSTSFITVPDHNAFDLAAGDWTMEFWVYPTVNNFNHGCIEKDQFVAGERSFEVSFTSSNLTFEYTTDGSTNLFQIVGTVSGLNQWHYIVVQRTGTLVESYVNGTLQGASFNVSTDVIWDGPTDLYVGTQIVSSSFLASNNYMDDVRITVGTARYSGSTMTVPTAVPSDPAPIEETFIAGDPAFATRIDGLTTSITSTATDIDGTLNVDGATTLVTTLNVQGAVDLDTTLNVDGIADFNANVEINSGVTLTIWNSTNTDKAIFSHDGTDFNTAFTNTTNWNITGLAGSISTDSGLIMNDATAFISMWGSSLFIRDAGVTDYARFSHDGTDFNTFFFNTTDWNLTGGVVLKIWNSGTTDNAAFNHDGTDFNTAFTNTVNWNLTGLSGDLIMPTGGAFTNANAVDIRSGGGTYLALRGTPLAQTALYYNNAEQATTRTAATGSLHLIQTYNGPNAQQRVHTYVDSEQGKPAVYYEYSSTITATDPTAGRVQFDSLTIGSIANLYIDDTTDATNDASWFLDNLGDGDVLTIRSETDPADYIIASVNGTPTDNTGWWTIPLTLIYTGAIFADTDKLIISLQWVSQAGGGGGALQDTWLFDSSIVNASPAANSFRFNTLVLGNIATMRVKDEGGTFNFDDMEQWFTPGMHFRIFTADNITEYWDFVVASAGTSDQTGYWNIDVRFISGSASAPIDTNEYVIQITTEGFVEAGNLVPAVTTHGSMLAWDNTKEIWASSDLMRLNLNTGSSTGGRLKLSPGGYASPENGTIFIDNSASAANLWFMQGTTANAGFFAGLHDSFTFSWGWDAGSVTEILSINSSGNVIFPNSAILYQKERAAAGGFSATFGQLWVKDDAPNTLWFTDDVGTDFQLGTIGNQPAYSSDFVWGTGSTSTAESGSSRTVQSGATFEFNDNATLDFGTGNDVSLSFDGTDFNIAGIGNFNVTGFTDMVINARIVPDAITNPAESVTATNVITAAESGKTFFLNAAGGFTSTLPVPAAGLKYTFIVATAPTTAYIITTNAGANILEGTFLDIVGELQPISAQDTLNFVASTSLVGDNLEIESDGTSWFCTAFSKADGGITVSVV